VRLHARVIKPDFWADMEFAQVFSPLERHFYLGLMQLADDSGCLLDSPLEFKAKLYPIDFDITPQQIEEWRDHLIRAGKVVPYTASGKRCLYLVNFHKHQQKRYWERPEVPLPAWVTWQPTPTAKHRGTYQHGDPLVSPSSAVDTPPVQDWSGSGTSTVLDGSADGAGVVPGRSQLAPDVNADADVNAQPSGGVRGTKTAGRAAPPADAADAAPRAEGSQRRMHWDEPDMRAAEALREAILANNPEARVPSNLAVWANEARLMRTQDGRSAEDILAHIEWCQRDSFWRANCLSMPALRRHFDQLTLQMRDPRRNGRPLSRASPGRRAPGPYVPSYEETQERQRREGVP
jgi:hypothetical protein